VVTTDPDEQFTARDRVINVGIGSGFLAWGVSELAAGEPFGLVGAISRYGIGAAAVIGFCLILGALLVGSGFAPGLSVRRGGLTRGIWEITAALAWIGFVLAIAAHFALLAVTAPAWLLAIDVAIVAATLAYAVYLARQLRDQGE
jgi:hypothetical protein